MLLSEATLGSADVFLSQSSEQDLLGWGVGDMYVGDKMSLDPCGAHSAVDQWGSNPGLYLRSVVRESGQVFHGISRLARWLLAGITKEKGHLSSVGMDQGAVLGTEEHKERGGRETKLYSGP